MTHVEQILSILKSKVSFAINYFKTEKVQGLTAFTKKKHLKALLEALHLMFNSILITSIFQRLPGIIIKERYSFAI